MPRGDDDVPAAHSMDSSWFAVDEDGAVAVFDTGEGGAVPTEDRFPKGGEAGGGGGLDPFAVLVRLVRLRAEADPELAALLDGTPDADARLEQGLMEADEAERDEIAAWVGLYWYSCTEAFATPFVRSVVVPRPLMVAEWPADLAARLRRAGLPVRFARAASVAAGEHVPIETWDGRWRDRDGRLHRTDGGRLDPGEEGGAEGMARDDAPPRAPRADAAIRALIADALREGMEPPRGAPPLPSAGLLEWLKRLFS